MNIEEFSNEIGISTEYLLRLTRNVEKLYKTSYIDKKNGSKRKIEAPNQELKGLQRWILDNVLSKIEFPNAVCGYVTKKSIKNNAKVHIGKSYILIIDIENFFPSIPYSKILNVFEKQCNLERDCAILFTKLNTLNNHLPQGGVCSPSLSNCVFKSIDVQIETYCMGKRIPYTRYADDLTFSANLKDTLFEVKQFTEQILVKQGFKPNISKTRIISGQGPLRVTGINLNNNQLSIGNKKKKKLRSQLLEYILNDNKEHEKEILGMLSFLRNIEPDKYDSFLKYIVKLKNMKKIK